MIKDFTDYIVLTSQQPTAFLNFRNEGEDVVIMPRRDPSIGSSNIIINGLDLASSDPSIYGDINTYSLQLNTTDTTASFLLNSNSNMDFDQEIIFDIYDPPGGSESRGDDEPIDSVSVNILNRHTIANISSYPTSNILVDNESSFMVLRTNPKFTGNIKLVVDSSNYLYLDTFKISDELNNKKYRHQRVSSESFISSDIRRVFGKIPESQLYKIDDEDTLNISVPNTNVNKQFDLTYSYGARLFEDDLYPDDYALLAPLWVNNKLPDYFTIFRLPGAYNEETYTSERDISSLPTKFISDGVLLKTWGMKETTPIGTYLRNHLIELNTENLRSPLFLPLSNPSQSDQDYNTYNGISWKSGITTGLSEHPYSFSKIENYTQTNEFLSSGYERLNLVSSNLINFEYAFSDDDASLYSMNRYFGLYLTDNPLYKISYYKEEPDSSVAILSLDDKNAYDFFDNDIIFDASNNGDIANEYKNRIFSLNDVNSVNRISKVSDINGENEDNISEWINKPGDNIFSIPVSEVSTNTFITFQINNILTQGEHLRIINKSSSNQEIWEVYGSNSDQLDEGECGEYCTSNEQTDSSLPTVYRTCFSSKGEISDQIKAIRNAFDKFIDYNAPFNTSILKSDIGQLSIEISPNSEYDEDKWVFQRVTSNVRNDINNPNSEFSKSAQSNDISFFGIYTPSDENIKIVDGVNKIPSVNTDYSIAGPYDFEIYGDREFLEVSFINTEEYYVYSFDDSVQDLFTKYTMYLGDDSWYRLIKDMDIEVSVDSSISSYNISSNHVIDPTELNDNHIILTSQKIYTINGLWNAYNTYGLSISLMGINNVKDFDTIVYDSSLGFNSDYEYKRDDDESVNFKTVIENTTSVISERNSYTVTSGTFDYISDEIRGQHNAETDGLFHFNTFNNYMSIKASTDTLITYAPLDGTMEYNSYDPNISLENINDYYTDPSTKGELKYGLTIPTVMKWVGLGNDCRTNEYGLLLDGSILTDNSTNFLPFESNFQNELSYPSFKYLSPGDKAWENYIYYDINDTIKYTNDGEEIQSSFKELMFNEPYLDVFSKLVYSNSPDVSEVKNRSSLVYYNVFKESIDMLVNGLSLSIKVDLGAIDSLSAKDWDKFRVTFMSSPSINKTNNNPLEIIINENTNTILIVWYQGADDLNYNKRFSSIFNGNNNLYQYHSSDFDALSFKYDDIYWSYNKAPFVLNTSHAGLGITNIHDSSINYDASTCSLFAQVSNNNYSTYSSTFNAYLYPNSVSNNTLTFNKQYNTFKGYVDYTYVYYDQSFGKSFTTTAYNYMNNINLYNDTVCNLEQFKYIINNSYISCNIIKDDSLLTNTNFTTPPLNITLNEPREYKNTYVHNGYFKPKFNNIFNFTYNESNEILNSIELDLTLSNTNLTGANDIKQYWYNKIVSTVTTEDVSTKNSINYLDTYSPFLSQWDEGYYYIDDIKTNGWYSTLELPSFFGSKLINLPETLTLDKWNNTAVFKETDSYTTLQFNLTQQIIESFRYNNDFTVNWEGLGVGANNITSYIKDTIVKYYKFSKNKIETFIYTKPYDGNRLHNEFSDGFKLNEDANVNGVLNVTNNEYIYNIQLEKLPDLSYFIAFKLFEK